MNNNYTVVIPAYNEENAIEPVVQGLLHAFPKERLEIIVVNDSSTDRTAEAVKKFPIRLISNIQNSGYGFSLKQGILAATNEHIIILDADGSYPVAALPALISEYEKGFDMVVGARKGVHYRGSRVKRIGRFFFRILSEFATGKKIPDINSGCRVFKKKVVIKFFPTLSSGFSFTTTITLAFMLNAHSVAYLPIEYHKREGASKVKYVRDTLRSAQIIIEAIVFYNPVKIFILCAGIVFTWGILCAALAVAAPWVALLLFLAVAGSIGMVGLGFIAVFLKFMHTSAHE